MHPCRQGLLILLLLSLSFSANGVQPLDLTFAVPAVAGIVVIFLASTSMLAASISNPQLEAWAKTEIREFVAGLLLIALVIALFVSSNGISIAFTGTNDYVKTSMDIVKGWLSQIDTAYIITIMSATRIRLAATFSPFINIPLWYVSISYSTNPLAGVAIMLTTLTMATQALTNCIFLLEGLKMLVVYLQVIGPVILLPLAFIFRLIPFSRRLGNTLIAISIGGMVFLPFSIIIADALNHTIPDSIYPHPTVSMGDFMLNLMPEPISLVTATVGPICEQKFIRLMLSLTDPIFSLVVCLPLFFIYPVGPALFAACYSLVQYVVYPLVTEILQLAMMITLGAWDVITTTMELIPGAGYGTRVFDALTGFLKDTNNLVLLIYLDIILIMTITVTGIRSLSAALGGEWYMAGIQRLI